MYNFEYFAELESYEARREYEEWLDEQEDDMVRLHEQEMSPEVVEWTNTNQHLYTRIFTKYLTNLTRLDYNATCWPVRNSKSLTALA